MKRCKVIENLRHSKPKDFWKFFSKRKHVSNDINPEEFFNFFSAMQHDLLTNPGTGASSFCDSHNFNGTECNYDELHKPISIEEIHVAIKRLKTNKAFGSDQLLNEYFIVSFDIISAHLVDLFNAILNSGCFPDEWSRGIIVPLHKKGDPNDVNNYRGITLVSSFFKMFTSILNKRVNDWVENNNIVSDAQFGLRKARSTVDAILVLNTVIQKILNEKM